MWFVFRGNAQDKKMVYSTDSKQDAINNATAMAHNYNVDRFTARGDWRGKLQRFGEHWLTTPGGWGFYVKGYDYVED